MREREVCLKEVDWRIQNYGDPARQDGGEVNWRGNGKDGESRMAVERGRHRVDGNQKGQNYHQGGKRVVSMNGCWPVLGVQVR